MAGPEVLGGGGGSPEGVGERLSGRSARTGCLRWAVEEGSDSKWPKPTRSEAVEIIEDAMVSGTETDSGVALVCGGACMAGGELELPWDRSDKPIVGPLVTSNGTAELSHCIGA